MEANKSSGGLDDIEQLAARWDKIAFSIQGSPFEDLKLKDLARNVGTQPWKRPGGRVKGDTVARYIYFSFEELLSVEKLDLKSATLLLEICETLFRMEREYESLGALDKIDELANQQRSRFFDEFGLFEDFPVALSNLRPDLRELCAAEGVITFVDLMGFLDRLADKAMIGGPYRLLQNIFAHGDEKGLCVNFPFRPGYRGFHLPEALSFALNRINAREMEALVEYFSKRGKGGLFGIKRKELPAVVERVLLPAIFQCLLYFGQRDSIKVRRLYDADELARQLLHLHNPEREDLVRWLTQLALGIFHPARFADVPGLKAEIEGIELPAGDETILELRRVLDEKSAGS